MFLHATSLRNICFYLCTTVYICQCIFLQGRRISVLGQAVLACVYIIALHWITFIFSPLHLFTALLCINALHLFNFGALHQWIESISLLHRHQYIAYI